MALLFSAVGLMLWLLIGHVMVRRRHRKSLAQFAKLDAVTGFEEASEEENIYFHGSRRFVAGLYIAAFMEKLCWPYTAFIDEDKALAFCFGVTSLISPIRTFRKFDDGSIREIHRTDPHDSAD